MKEGKDYKGVQQNWGQLATTLLDGSMDAFVLPLTWPHPRTVSMVSAGKVTVLSISKAKMDSGLGKKLLGVPGNIPITLSREQLTFPADQLTLISEDNMLRGIGSAFAEIVHKDMSKDLAKAITKAHIETLAQLKGRAKMLNNVGLAEMDPVKSGFCGKSPLKYHPGAVEAWTEAGFNLADCAK